MRCRTTLGKLKLYTTQDHTFGRFLGYFFRNIQIDGLPFSILHWVYISLFCIIQANRAQDKKLTTTIYIVVTLFANKSQWKHNLLDTTSCGKYCIFWKTWLKAQLTKKKYCTSKWRFNTQNTALKIAISLPTWLPHHQLSMSSNRHVIIHMSFLIMPFINFIWSISVS